MIIIAGYLIVARVDRDAYVADCIDVVESARAAPGCLDYSITTDSLNPARVVVYERWQSQQELLAFRGSGPSSDQQTAILKADVKRYGISTIGDP